jgi:putative hemolysin
MNPSAPTPSQRLLAPPVAPMVALPVAPQVTQQQVAPQRPVASPAPAPASYAARLARGADEVAAAQRLRFEVFNLELGEGLVRSYGTRLDADAFDAACDHLLVLEAATGRVVGTYRLQTGTMARANLGYYSEREFDFTPFESRRAQMVELGRACVQAEHRSFAVLSLLWRGIAAYAQQRGARYLVGCSSLTSLDETVGAAAWRRLQGYAVEDDLATVPRAAFACSLAAEGPPPKIPSLMTAHLALGAKVCAPPAIDREFGTIDFLTWLDLEASGVAEGRRRARFVKP